MRLLNISRDYFNGFGQIARINKNDARTNTTAILKIISYFTLIIPLGFAAVYGFASLKGRAKKNHPLTPHDQAVNDQGKLRLLDNDKNLVSKNGKKEDKHPPHLHDEAVNDQRELDENSKRISENKNKLEISETENAAVPLLNTLNESFKQYKTDLLNALPATIERQKVKRSYSRLQLETLREQHRNPPIPLSSHPNPTKHFSKKAVYYGYNAENVRDAGWGCAWRAIQTSLSAYGINPSFEELFHLFGPYENLKRIYENQCLNKPPSNETDPKSSFKLPDDNKKIKAFAPYHLGTGWAEPFIGHLVMHFYNIPSALETVNGVPNCHAPKEVFPKTSLKFEDFKNRLEKHFLNENAAPVMIDDGLYALNIVGIESENNQTTLWIGDPHIKEPRDGVPSVGLYRLVLGPTGAQVSCSLNDVDKHQISSMSHPGSFAGLHFNKKEWMVLFPLSSQTSGAGLTHIQQGA